MHFKLWFSKLPTCYFLVIVGCAIAALVTVPACLSVSALVGSGLATDGCAAVVSAAVTAWVVRLPAAQLRALP